MSSKAEQLKALKAKREAAEAAEKNRVLLESDDDAIEAELREEERKLRDLEDQAALRDAYRKHGINGVVRIETRFGMLIVRGYTHAEYKETQAMIRSSNSQEAVEAAVAQANLNSVIHPSREKVEQILRDAPMIEARLTTACTMLTEGRDAEFAGKA